MKIFLMLAVTAGLIFSFMGCANPSASSTSAATSYVKGAITAMGSVWVNGTEYSTTSSTVKVDGVSATDTNLKVGMVVELDSSTDAAGRATATAINYESSLKGLVGTITLASGSTPGTFTVFGQTVQVLSTTVFQGTTDLSTLAAGSFVEVSGQPDATTHNLVADLVEVKSSTTEDAKLNGTVSALAAGASSGSFTLTLENGSVFTINYSGTLNSGVANGSLVRVEFTPSQVSGTTLTLTDASKIEVRSSDVRSADGEKVELEGVVANFDATLWTFTLDGQKVAGTASLTSGMQNGSRVEVEGTLSGTTLTATKIHIKTPEADLLEASGQVTSIDATNKTFTVGTRVFQVSSTTIFNDKNGVWTGTNPVSTMTTSDQIEVKYYVDSATNRAVKIERQ